MKTALCERLGIELPAGARTLPRARQARTAGPAAAENYRLGGRVSILDVVKTFRGRLPTNQSLGVFAPLQSAKLG
jgi:hypothetical protein